MQTVQELFIFPLKSGKALPVRRSLVEEKGLADDRRFILVDEKGQFITGRTHPQLTQVSMEFSNTKLTLSALSKNKLTVQKQAFSEATLDVTVWSDNLTASLCHPDLDQWFSDYLELPCQLVYLGKHSHRIVKDKTTQVSFADAYPILLINQASVSNLNTKLTTAVSPLHFRPNIVIKGHKAFEEDNWATVKIGEVTFEVSKACSRCHFVNVDPRTGVAKDNDTLAALSQFRFHQGNIDFGINLTPLNEGLIQAGDQLTVLTTHQAATYASQNGAEQETVETINIHYVDSNITKPGDTQQVLLEQAEQAGIQIPFSCRSGKCGRCKTKLLKGRVNNLSQQGLYDAEITAGYILACSCIPISDISIEH